MNTGSRPEHAVFQRLIGNALEAGATRATVIETRKVCVEDRLADLCREPKCENFGLSLSCPPHVPAPEAFRRTLKSYRYVLVYKIDVPSEILFSDQRHEVFRLLHDVGTQVKQAALAHGYPDVNVYAGGSCRKIFCRNHQDCRVVTRGGECRHAGFAHPSMSGVGVNVSKLMHAAGWKMNRADPQSVSDAMSTLCAMVLIF